MPDISIIIPSWNGRHLLSESLPSIMNQKGVDAEVIVVDNGSEDGTMGWLKKEWPDVKRLPLYKNEGFSAACNLGIINSTGRYIGIVNNDVLLAEDWAGIAVKTLEKRDDIHFLASLIMIHSSELPDEFKKHSFSDYGNKDMSSPLSLYIRNYDGIIDSAGDMLKRSGEAFKRGYGRPLKSIYLKSRHIFGACAAAAVYRRTMLSKIGLFDEELFAYYEDVDLAWRANNAGFRCLYVPEMKVLHRLSSSASCMDQNWLRSLKSRNVLYITLKNMAFDKMYAKLIEIVLFHIKDVILNKPLRLFVPAIAGKLWALTELGRILKHKKATRYQAGKVL